MTKTATKSDLISNIAERTGFTKADSARYTDAYQEAIIEYLQKYGKVTITGFLTFEKVHKEASVAHNPRTNEPVNVPARNVPKIKAGSKLKEALNQ